MGIWYPSSSPQAPVTVGNILQTVALDGQVSDDDLPIVVFSHGSAGWYGDRSESAQRLADAGFVAVSMTYPGDNYQDSNDKAIEQLINRPRITSRVLDFVTEVWPGKDHVDKSKIGFYGFSAGGFTGLVAIGGVPDWKLFASHCAAIPAEGVCNEGSAAYFSHPKAAQIPASAWHHDPRIKAAVLVSPGWAFSFDATSISNINVPVELWGGSKDTVVPFESNIGYVQRYLSHVVSAHEVHDARHNSFLKPCSEVVRAKNPDFCSDEPGFDRPAFQADFNTALVGFFQSELMGKD